MEIIIVDNDTQGSQKAFELFTKAYENNAKVYGLATGSTPLKLYELIRHSDMDFTDCVSINLDEYVGLAPTNEHSYYDYMHKQLFADKPFAKNFLPNGLETDDQKEINRYEKILEDYPIDFQILGLGNNAHIGFNEPNTPFTQKTHKVHLTGSTIEANKRFFDKKEDVPIYAYSMGLASIMAAKKIVLLAFGKSKAQAVKDMIEGEVTTKVPASILQTHKDVTIILDKDAAMLLGN